MNYRPEIDGLRAVAVLPVILFHAGFGALSGGFIGVDVFFVISGYLITGILLSDLEAGRFSILRFYERRARRILPALVVVILASSAAALWIMLPNELVEFSKSIGAAVLFLSNVFFWQDTGYFATAAEFKPLLHTWSLAVEEQYYVLFPPALFIVWKFGRRGAFLSVLLVALGSLALSVWAVREMPSATFFLLPTRAWELVAGALAAFATLRGVRLGRGLREGLSALGLMAILVPMVLYDESTLFPGEAALLPVLGTVSIVLFAGPDTLAGRVLAWRPFVWIGLISYSAYLWHQPVFAFARLHALGEPEVGVMAVLVALSLGLAYLTWRFVEQPFRGAPARALPRRGQVFGASALMSAALLAVASIGVQSGGLPGRGQPVGDVAARLKPNHGLAPVCDAPDVLSLDACQSGAAPRALLWGDSFTMHLVQGLLASAAGTNLRQMTYSACSPVETVISNTPRNPYVMTPCWDFNQSVLSWLDAAEGVDLVIISSSFYGVLSAPLRMSEEGMGPPIDHASVVEAMRETVERVRAAGKRVVVVSPTPQNGTDIGLCTLRTLFKGGAAESCDFELDENAPNLAFMREIEAFVPVYWLTNDICPEGRCDTYRDEVTIYLDEGHLSHEGSAYLGEKYGWFPKMEAMAR